MKASETGLALIRAFEGKRLTGYLDAVKIPTIGWGHTEMAGGLIKYTNGESTNKVLVGQQITEKEAVYIHERDMAQFEIGVLKLLKVSPRQSEYDAMVALAFNIGVGAFGKSSVLRKFNAGDAQGAADAFLMWNKAGGKVLAGLTRRRNAERALFMGDIALASKYAGVALPGYGSRLEPAVVNEPEETGARPDEVQGTPATQSSTVLSQIGNMVSTVLVPIGGFLSGIDWRVIAAISAAGVIAFSVYTISERMRHARESGV